ncbi:transposase family protein [Brucella rhizosphaerae]|uniref:Putative lipoprotein n=1 Tax=Brucella rhizosphaerae TaxID=571254 RepID=A0A256FAG0_9HYPH|nr:transposase family protein [Brucella rhizosphaerae]OYR11798.1 putative lipoprotein [Brucella rhizosphaerae]
MKKQVFSLIAVMTIALAASGCQSTDRKDRDWGNNKSDAPSRSAPSHSA